MVPVEAFRELALAFEDVEELPHFEKTSFRVRKKIFATLHIEKAQAVVKLSDIDQSVFAEYHPDVIYPVKGAWGKKGWTMVELGTVPTDMCKDILNTAYCQVAPKKLADKYRPKDI